MGDTIESIDLFSGVATAEDNIRNYYVHAS